MMDDSKLRELILYIADKCQVHNLFGKVKLNKILFFSDFLYYQRTGESITGFTYIKQEMGPVPYRMWEIIEEMRAAGELAIVPRQCYTHTQQRPTPLRAPDLSRFSAPEIALVDNVVEEFRERTADEVSALSHLFIGYDLVDLNDEIPYYSVYCRKQCSTDITPDVIEIAKAIDAQRQQS